MIGRRFKDFWVNYHKLGRPFVHLAWLSVAAKEERQGRYENLHIVLQLYEKCYGEIIGFVEGLEALRKNRVDVERVDVPYPKPLKAETCKKCKTVIAEPKELIRTTKCQ
jgi:hypothetical protein